MTKSELTRFKAVVIGGSAGSFQGVVKILSQLPEDFPLPIVLCLHRLKHVRNGFVEALSIKSVKEIKEPYDKESLRRGQVYLAPSNYHMGMELGNTFSLSTEEMVNNSRPSIDLTFDSMSYVFRKKLLGILLSGANRDGAQGMKKIKSRGGLTIVQDPEECMIAAMPEAAMKAVAVDHVMKIQEIVDFLNHIYKQY